MKNYLRTNFDKLGVWSRLKLALYVAGHGGVSWRGELVPLAESQYPRTRLRYRGW